MILDTDAIIKCVGGVQRAYLVFSKDEGTLVEIYRVQAKISAGDPIVFTATVNSSNVNGATRISIYSGSDVSDVRGSGKEIAYIDVEPLAYPTMPPIQINYVIGVEVAL